MYRFLLLFFPLFTACTGQNFDEATIPAEQVSAEMAFTRHVVHGEIEPLFEVGQQLENWQFFVAGKSTSSVMGSEKSTVLTLKDRSGIGYSISSISTPESIVQQIATGGYGYGTGEIVSIDRDLLAGEISVVVALRSWRPRK